MKKTTLLLLAAFALSFVASEASASRLKYVFFLISDGTGVNIVMAGENYRAATSENKKGHAPLPYAFSKFPVVGMATTYSASSRVTDSSASGTALASGVKTNNGFLGVLPDGITPVNSICWYAKQKGMRVGVATNVCIDHATPASFYGHNRSRNNYHAIGHDLIECGYVDFFGGGAFHSPTDKSHPFEPTLYELAERSGITVAYGYDEYKAKAAKAKKMLLVQTEEEIQKNGVYLPYAIDNKGGSMKIEDVMRAELDFLMKDNPKNGFFLMNEIGGKVDMACHSNDAAAAFLELEGVNNCVQIALDFYQKHPDETLIILTSDHDTGGSSNGVGKYEMHPAVLQHQTISKDKLSDDVRKWREERGDSIITWEETKALLTKCFGFWDTVKLNEKQEKQLKDAYERSFTPNKNRKEEKGLYSTNENISVVATQIINNMACVGWNVTSHTGGYVPVYAIGKGAEAFSGMNDNSEIPRIISRLLGIKME